MDEEKKQFEDENADQGVPEIPPDETIKADESSADEQASDGADLEMPDMKFNETAAVEPSENESSADDAADLADKPNDPEINANPDDLRSENAEEAMSESIHNDSEAEDSGSVKPTVEKAKFEFLTDDNKSDAKNLDILLDVSLPISIELGRTAMAIENILNLGPGSVVELDKLAGEPVDLLVNNKLLAKGEVVVIDENFGVRITSMISPQDRIRSLA